MSPNIPDLCARGFRVFPVRHATKRPFKTVRWKDAATSDVDEARRLWKSVGLLGGSQYNAAIVTDGLAVIDFDTDPPPGWMPEGKPDTFRVKTPKGEHWFFTTDEAYRPGPIVAGEIDLKAGTGAYVLAPGSLHPNGGTYEISHDAPIRKLPSWMAYNLQKRKGESRERESHLYPADEGEDSPFTYNVSAVENLLDTTPGNRNLSLWQFASDMYRERATGKMSETRLRQILLAARQKIVGPDFSADEFKRTVDSAYDSIFSGDS